MACRHGQGTSRNARRDHRPASGGGGSAGRGMRGLLISLALDGRSPQTGFQGVCSASVNDNDVDIMSGEPARLGEVEQLVLLAVLRLGDEAYAVPVRNVIAKEAGVRLSRGSIYITLDRLEEKGLAESRFGDPISEPGGKSRRLFRIRPAGLSALRASQRAVARLAAGTPLARKA